VRAGVWLLAAWVSAAGLFSAVRIGAQSSAGDVQPAGGGSKPAVGDVQPAGGAQVPAAPAIAIASFRITGWENLPGETADAASWLRRFQETWRQAYATRVELSEARPAAAGTPAAELEVAVTAAGFRTRVALPSGGGRKLEARASVHGHQGPALLTALAGDLFFLWAQAGGFGLPPARSAPLLAGRLALDSLKLLPGWKVESSEPLDCAASSEGPVLLFPDRLLGLARNLDASPATAGDLLLRAPVPQGFRADRLWLDRLGRPVLFSSATGETLSYVEGLPPERRQTGLRQPVHAALLPRGGLAVVASGRITRALRRNGAVSREQLSLPGGFYGAVEGDGDGHLWVLDLVERRVRILDDRGEEARSLKPAVDPSRLPFPQVFLPLPDGGLLLGGSGELWRFDRWGAPLWRMHEVFTGVREPLPAYFRVALAPMEAPPPREGSGGQAPASSACTLYLLDPMGRRLLRFDDAELPGPGAAEPSLEPGSQLPALLALLESGELSGGAVAQYALDQGLPLLALTFLQAAPPESVPSARLARLAKARLLHGLGELADRYESELRLSEAEAALAEAARLAGELRAVDPLEPSYARELPGLVARRDRLREELLQPGEQALQAALEPAAAVLSLRNTSGYPADSVSVQLRWAGFPPGAGVEWMQPVRSGYEVRLPLPLPPGLEGYAEELTLRLSVLVSWRQEGQRQRRFLQASYLLPPSP
jgi:hypothetical protein